MTWVPPPRTADAQAIHAAAAADRRANPDRFRLDAELLIERAAGDRFDPADFVGAWREGVDAYLTSAVADGRLNALGQKMVADTVVGRLRAGARTAAVHTARQPTPLAAPPIVIIGGWRTGTTFLYRLLGTDPQLHAPLPAELGAPWRFAGLDPAARRVAIEAAAPAHNLLHTLNPTMAAVHDSGALLPEECVLAMGSDMRNWGFTSTVRLDGYAEWLAEQDFAGSYARYRSVLELLADGDDRRFVLKAPAHTAELDHLVDTFPGAVVVHLHRDIVETIASGASLFAVFRSTYSDDVDPVDVGRFQTEQTERWFRRAGEFRARPAADAATFVDVDYDDLVADPASTVRRIYAAAALAPPADVDAFVAAYHAAHPRTARGPHRYAPSDFGLDPASLRTRFSFLPTRKIRGS